MTIYAGIDLSWTGRHESGICVVRDVGAAGAELIELGARVASTADLVELLTGFGEPVVAAVDAPLVVSAERDAERQIGRAFGAYKASAHSANVDLLRRQGRMAGPDLAEALVEAGFTLDPAPLLRGERRSTALEVYPHAAHVRLFNLTERIPYKVKKGRRVAFRREQFRTYQDHLRGLLERRWSTLVDLDEIRAVLDPGAVEVRGKALKRLEDTLDAVTCVYVALHAVTTGWNGTDVLGDFQTGAVVVPRWLHLLGR